MKKNVRDIITYGGLALAGYALLNKVAQPAAAAPATSGVGDGSTIMQVHPGQQHPAHPWWRWFRGTQDYNSMQNYPAASESTFGPSSWAYSNWDPYSGYGYGGSGELTFGGGPSFDYEPVTYELPDSLESRASQNY